MSILSDLRTYLKTYSGLKTNAPVWVDHLGPSPTEYALVPLAGGKVLETYIDGSSLCSFPFAFRTKESTADDLQRLENVGFFESFSDWMESQTDAGVLPSLSPSTPSGEDTGSGTKKALSIEASGWGYLYEQGKSDTGVYQIQCRLIYEQEA